MHPLREIELAAQREIDLIQGEAAQSIPPEIPLFSCGRRTERTSTTRSRRVDRVIQSLTAGREGIFDIDRYAGSDIHTSLHRSSQFINFGP